LAQRFDRRTSAGEALGSQLGSAGGGAAHVEAPLIVDHHAVDAGKVVGAEATAPQVSQNVVGMAFQRVTETAT
jgi:hypothetical protein